MAARQFVPDQKIFAKVRGYPPWPAKVLGPVDEAAGKQKYSVYFYGTHETAVCKREELYDYIETREKYGKPLKRKNFSEAIAEIEAEIDPSKRQIPAPVEPVATPVSAPASIGDKDSDDDNLVIDETPLQKAKSKAEPAKGVKRKHSSEANDMSIELTSRSGRKIKPKKFLDEPAEFSTSTPLKTTKPKIGRESVNSIEENGKLKKSTEPDADASNGDRAELHWDSSQTMQELISKSERSDLPKTVKKDFKKSLKKKVEEVKSQKPLSSETENLELLKVEVHLLEANCRIKNCLSLSKANCEDCLKEMDEILDLKLNALMLKKHPEVVDTVKKLRKYVGNLSEWQLSADEERSFLEGAQKIRMKADTMYAKFKSLFAIPQDKNFFEVYSAEVASFEQKTSGLSTSEIYKLVAEPSE
ncbi:hypothetical protein V9T40_000437 [Parthenolecanium corni]|uniref:PWWP domain-containing protein n=1 Tax=Parthenolecanium corni TaxID=536013 RepID=A0AAN9Y1Q7_9HEMI